MLLKNVLQCLDINKVAGMDQILSKVLKEAADISA